MGRFKKRSAPRGGYQGGGHESRTHDKVATWLRGLIELPFMRPPVPKPKKQEILTLRELMTNAGLNVIPEADMNRIANGL